MLPLNRITGIIPHSEEWHKARLCKFNASENYNICAERGLGADGNNHIRSKVSEHITGLSAKVNITTEAIVHGVKYEPFALKFFEKKTGLKTLTERVVEGELYSWQHILYDEMFAATPDALVLDYEYSISADEEFINCSTLEIKCPMNRANHVEFLEMETAADLKKVERKYYFQVLSQMFCANVFRGHFISYHPDFPEATRMAHIIFNRAELREDFTFLDKRFAEAKLIFHKKIEAINKKYS